MASETELPLRSASVPPGLVPGMLIADKYELLRKLGTGAMGEVWAARHKTLDEEVAVKLVMRNIDQGDGTSAESRFLLEARVAASLSRKTRHIVAVTDHGQDGSLGYLVMELLAGESLYDRVARTGPLPLAKVVPLINQIARGLSIAHAEGVTHRDLKPSNIFVTADEDGNALVKVLDFGIAKLRRSTNLHAAHVTQRGFLLGTPAYMSPEQARGKPIDHRVDVWALAVIAYHMLTGEFPFDGESAQDLVARICRVQSIPIRERRPDLPPIVSDFFDRAFARRLEDRFQSAAALAGALEQLEPLSGGAPLAKPPPPAIAVVDDDFALAGLGDSDAKNERKRLDEPLTETSLSVAGLPRRRRLWQAIVAALLVGGVVAGTGTLLAVYFEREPPRAPAIRPPDPPPLASVPLAIVPESPESASPSPSPAPSLAPTPAPHQVSRTPARSAPPAATPQPDPAPSAATATLPTTPAAASGKRSHDKSEIF